MSEDTHDGPHVKGRPMKAKTIRDICKGKILKWAKAVEEHEKYPDPAVAKIIREKSIITGGAIASMLMGEDVNDFDVYFRDQDSTFAVANYYVERFKKENSEWVNTKVGMFAVVRGTDRVSIHIKSAGVAAADGSKNKPVSVPVPFSPVNVYGEDDIDIDEGEPLPEEVFLAAETGPTISGHLETQYQYFEGTSGDQAADYIKSLASKANNAKATDYSPIFMTDNAITLSNKVQLVTRFYGEPEKIHGNYDYMHCMNYYTSWDNALVQKAEAMECIRTKDLKYVGSLYPICSIIRMRKFINRGWTINAGQIIKMVYQVSRLDLTDMAVLKEQLIGVDAAYFHELLTHMQNDIGAGKTIDQTYICNLIDQVFE